MNTANSIQNGAQLERKCSAWAAIIFLFFAGCTTALHIGKIPVAIPLLQDVWGLSLTQSGLIVSLHSILIATTGLLLGLIIRRLGYVIFAVIGVATVGVGSLLGSFATSFQMLLVGRSIEGLGWIISVIVLPSIISALSTARDRSFVMAGWASFLPIGAGTMLLIAPTLQEKGGWQLSWLVGSAVSFLAAAVVFLIAQKYRQNLTHLGANSGQQNYSDLSKRIVWLLSGCFLMYSCSYIPILSFLPLLLVETSGLTLVWASFIAALVMICNLIGSVLAGIFLRKGASPQRLIIIGAVSSGISAMILFAPLSNTGMQILAAFMFSSLSGLIPGVLFSTMPKAASQPASVGLLIGLMMQLAGIGMLLGGVIIPGAVDYFNTWAAAGWVTLFTASCCTVLAYFSGKQAYQ